jgi:exodeoxyribonuclease VII small subunit
VSTGEIVSFEPATGSELWRGRIGDADDVIARARRAWPLWAAQPLSTRIELLRRFANEETEILLIGHEGHEEVEGTAGEAVGKVKIVDGLESGEVPLKESMNKFKEGKEIINQCYNELKNAELQVETLVKKDKIVIILN